MNNFRYILIPLTISIIALISIFYLSDIKFSSKKSGFTITQDTKIDPNSKLAKYVTQEEIDDFAFRYWDIDDEIQYTNKHRTENETFKKLRLLLKAKDTKGVLNFVKDNNLSVDVSMTYNLTPLMYSSFYDDDITAKELINLGANIRATDRYKLSPLAYAIENNSTKTAKLLLDSGVKVDEIKALQFYITPPFYNNIDKLIISGDDIKIIFQDNYVRDDQSKDAMNPMEYVVTCNYIELAQMILESGYVPKLSKEPIDGLPGIKDGSDVKRSVYHVLDEIPNHEGMLELLLKYDVVGQPTKEELKGAYEECYDSYKDFAKTKEDFLSGKITLTIFSQQGLKRTLGYYEQYCADENATFNDIKTFFAWANETRKHYAIDKVLSSNRNNPNKVIYIDQNSTDQVNKN
ncbi:ankyrin repeat domain-containing protein [Campylobacter sp. CCUG 57310]|uniref:ankyrin repeat domain-containing protein n=1 Tax=Campylobacter sp. CCUG 57310 TaxID=2517362 RepID=UPI001565F826|nr:ankyrin repeat domain-containing protein [Campylobacter sp. CCUG 57310]QKF92798.1 ankyrin domain-containing protein [Campylobacter sp. CCUG 57310]